MSDDINSVILLEVSTILVHLLSTIYSIEPKDKIRRFDRLSKEVDCPNAMYVAKRVQKGTW